MYSLTFSDDGDVGEIVGISVGITGTWCVDGCVWKVGEDGVSSDTEGNKGGAIPQLHRIHAESREKMDKQHSICFIIIPPFPVVYEKQFPICKGKTMDFGMSF